jgi:hypothetical protein
VQVLRRLASILLASVLSLGVLAGCGGDDDSKDDGDDGPTESPSASETVEESYLPVPEGVELTDPGSDVAVGESAVIAWQPRQDLVGVLDINVTKLEQTTFEQSFEGWDVKAEEKKKVTPYFVSATVTNEGDTNLSQRLVPLYALDSGNTLVEPTKFTEEFKPCPGGELPKGFSRGDTARVCLVYLIGEGLKLDGVTFRPTADFDAITWSGEIEKLRPPKKTKKKGGDG